MFCEQMPCECNKPTPKPKAAPKPKPVVTVELPEEDLTPVIPSPRRNAMAAMKAAAKPIQRAVPDSERQPSKPSNDEKADFARAIRVLADILHPTERARYHKILSEKPTLAERRERWRLSQASRSSSRS